MLARNCKRNWIRKHWYLACANEHVFCVHVDPYLHFVPSISVWKVQALQEPHAADANDGDAHDGDAHDGDASDGDAEITSVPTSFTFPAPGASTHMIFLSACLMQKFLNPPARLIAAGHEQSFFFSLTRRASTRAERRPELHLSRLCTTYFIMSSTES